MGRSELPFQPQAQLARPRAPQYLSAHQRQPAAAVGEIGEDFGGHLLGFSTLAVSIGAIVGTRYGGMYGGVAGSLFGGAVVNIYRAVRFAMEGSPEADKEAIVSGTYALAAAGFGGAVIYKLDRGARARRNPSTPKARCSDPHRCGFRPAGP
jgi:hypothetical protein